MTDFRTCPLIIFDFDGTLADTASAIKHTAAAVLQRHGLPEERMKDIPQLIGPPFPEAFTLVFGYSPEDAQKITDDYRKIYGSLGPEAWPAFPGISELLQNLVAGGRTLAIASSKRTAFVEHSVRDAGIDGFFTYLEGKPSDAPQTKAETIAKVLAAAGTEDALMIGDRHYDIEAAHEVGIPGIGALWGKTAPREELERAGAEAIADTVSDLREILGA